MKKYINQEKKKKKKKEMRRLKVLPFCVLLLFCNVFISPARAQTKEEIQAVCDLKSASPEWNDCKDCNDPCSNCSGVQCSDGHVLSIKIINGGMESVPESIGNLDHLVALTLEGNTFTTLPESIGQLTNLSYLWLSDNSIETLPSSFTNLKSLTSLWLDKNFLKELPDDFTKLSNLIAIYLNGNELTRIPESKYSGLKWMNLDWNQLDCDEISQSTGLSTFVKGKCNTKKQYLTPASTSSESESKVEREGMSKGPIIAIVILCVSWVIGGVVLVVTCLKSKKSKTRNPDLENALIQ